ncbi:MAG: hypothetical protein ABW128_18605 [Rhizorhabdus sp.]
MAGRTSDSDGQADDQQVGDRRANKATPGEPDTPQEAHDETAANVRALRHGDDDPGRPD